MDITIPAYDTKKNKKIFTGIFDSDLLRFTKKVKPNHYMIKEQGYGLQEDAFQYLKELGCETVRIISKTKTEDFQFECLNNLTIRDYGHGKQRFFKCQK